MGLEDTALKSQDSAQPKVFDHFIPFGQGGAIDKISDGDLLPVGSDVLSQDMTEILLRADLSVFQHMFDELMTLTKKIELQAFINWLKDAGVITKDSYFPPEIFVQLYELTQKLAELYPINYQGVSTRNQLYKTEKDELTLSFIMENKLAACAEYATLAKAYLQLVGIASTWFSGDLLHSKDSEFSEKHTFIVIHLDQGDFIYDPARPLSNTSGHKFPRIVKLPGSFLEQMRQANGRRFVTGTDLLLKEDAYYGLSRGGNIVPERDIV